MILYINTTEFQKLELALVAKNFFAYFEESLEFNENFKTLELLEKFLQASKVKISEIKKIIVCSGPGSFTGIRVGASLAQSIGFALNIPVITLPKSKVPKDLSELNKKSLAGAKKLNYGSKPNITKSKKKAR